MSEYINCHVKLLLINNVIIEGIVQEWSDSTVKLLSLDKISVSILTHPKEDIRVIKIINQTQSYKKEDIVNNFSELEKEISNTCQQQESDLKIKTLVELKKDLIKQEKEIIANKLKNHTITEVKEVQYEQPRFFKK